MILFLNNKITIHNHHSNHSVSDVLIGTCFLIMWFILPIPTFILACSTLYFSSYFIKYRFFLYTLISLTFALIAYTQKSISSTDIERYYGMFSGFSYLNISDVYLYEAFKDNLYYIFNPICIILVSLFKNIQIISLFWVFIIYFFYFKACDNYYKFRNIILHKHQILLFITISIWGFILFTQVTDILKQAAATSIFFYGFTLFLLNKKIKSLFFIFISIGIHSTPLFLLPLFLYKKFTSKTIIILFIISIFLSFCNIMELIAKIFPSFGIFLLLQEKALDYTENVQGFASSLLRYDLLVIVTLLMLYLYKRSSIDAINKKIVFIGCIYICLVIANRHMVQNYVRFINMSHFIFAFIFIDLINSHLFIKNFKAYLKLILLVIFFIANFHITYYRTFGGTYISTYMDNSLLHLLTSSVPQYLSYRAF